MNNYRRKVVAEVWSDGYVSVIRKPKGKIRDRG